MSIIPWKKAGFSFRPLKSRGTFLSLQEEMNRLFDNFFEGDQSPYSLLERSELSIPEPAVDISEDSKEYTLKVELPGLETKDINLKVGEGYIALKGEKKSSVEKKDTHYIRRETSQGSFQRTIYLPDLADPQKVKAHFKNGVLTISVPKREEAIQKEKKVLIEAA
jgi:HSP20 family protein